MKYVVDMAKASADFDKCQERAKHLNFANSIVLGASAVCIAIMTVFSLFKGPTGVFNALLILLGLFVISSYIMTLLMRPLRMNARFYKMTRGGKLLDMHTAPCKESFGKKEWVVISVEDENGDVRKYSLGRVQRIENTRYTEPVLNLDHERLYIPYTGEDIKPERVEETVEAPVAEIEKVETVEAVETVVVEAETPAEPETQSED